MVKTLTVGADIRDGCTLTAAVPDLAGSDGSSYVIVAWRDRTADYITWRANVGADTGIELWAGHYGIRDMRDAVADMLTRAGYPHARAGQTSGHAPGS